jgi:hypothetical protein
MSNQKSRKDYVHVTSIKYQSQQSGQQRAGKGHNPLDTFSADISNLCEFFGGEYMEGHCASQNCSGYEKRFCYTPRKK